MGRVKIGLTDQCCEVCGNQSVTCFKVYLGREKHVFDSFECAIYAMMPKCAHCRCQIIGHGVQLGDQLFCSYTCANDGYLQIFEASVIIHEQAYL